MAQVIATLFLVLIMAGVIKMIFDVQMAKFKHFLGHFLK